MVSDWSSSSSAAAAAAASASSLDGQQPHGLVREPINLSTTYTPHSQLADMFTFTGHAASPICGKMLQGNLSNLSCLSFSPLHCRAMYTKKTLQNVAILEEAILAQQEAQAGSASSSSQATSVSGSFSGSELMQVNIFAAPPPPPPPAGPPSNCLHTCANDCADLLDTDSIC